MFVVAGCIGGSQVQFTLHIGPPEPQLDALAAGDAAGADGGELRGAPLDVAAHRGDAGCRSHDAM